MVVTRVVGAGCVGDSRPLVPVASALDWWETVRLGCPYADECVVVGAGRTTVGKPGPEKVVVVVVVVVPGAVVDETSDDVLFPVGAGPPVMVVVCVCVWFPRGAVGDPGGYRPVDAEVLPGRRGGAVCALEEEARDADAGGGPQASVVEGCVSVSVSVSVSVDGGRLCDAVGTGTPGEETRVADGPGGASSSEEEGWG